MFSSDFRQITLKSEAPRAERLFRAAVSAFCSLPRPSRREIAQLEDLILPLFEQVSVDAKRYVASALSECIYAPAAIVKRLASETVDIAAPLLIRSTALTDVDLIALIGRRGYDHARVIGRRPNLNPAIVALVNVIERKIVPFRTSSAPAARRKVIAVSSGVHTSTSSDRPRLPGEAEQDARRRLRAMMQPASPLISASRPQARTTYHRLREGALSGHAAFFQTALADALDKDFACVQEVGKNPSYAWLLDALRILDVSDEKAFLITAAIYPSVLSDLQAIRIFLLRYAAISRDEALQRIDSWQSRESAEPSCSESRFAG